MFYLIMAFNHIKGVNFTTRPSQPALQNLGFWWKHINTPTAPSKSCLEQRMTGR